MQAAFAWAQVVMLWGIAALFVVGALLAAVFLVRVALDVFRG